MLNYFKKLSLIRLSLIVIIGILVYLAMGETKSMANHNVIDSVSTIVTSIDTIKNNDTMTIIKDTVQIDTLEVIWQSKWGNQTGIASMYGYKDGYNGKKTASGTIFDTYNSNQCAHKHLPFGTLLRVENLQTGLSTIVKVTDRGPFAKGRIIDLSYKSMNDIKMKNLAKVKLTIISIKDKTIDYKKNISKKEVKKVKKIRKPHKVK